MTASSRIAALATIGSVAILASTSHASWKPDGSPLAPEGGARIVSDDRGGVFGATAEGVAPRFYHLAVSGDVAFGWPPAGLELVPGNTFALHATIHPIAAQPDGEGGSFILTEEQGPWPGNGGFLDPVQLYLHRRTANGNVARGWTAEGVLIESAWLDHRIAANNLPSMVSDGFGGILVAWLIGGGWDPNPHALVQRLGPDGSRKWNVDGVDACGPAGVGTLPSVVADGLGGALIAWAQWDSSGTSVRVRGQHILPSGALAWGVGGRPISKGAFDRMSEALSAAGGSPWVTHAHAISAIPDGDGGAILCWAGSIGSDLNIFATRVTRTGGLPWKHDVLVCSAPGEQASVVCTPLGHGGAAIAWRDGRNGADVEVFAQAVSPDGRALWARDGVVAGRGSGDRNQLVARSDARHGVYLAWVDPPQGGRVFAQHLSGSGRRWPGWPESGVLVSRTANSYVGESVGLQLVEGERGTVVAAWSSARVGTLAMLLTSRGPAAAPAIASVETSSGDASTLPVETRSTTFSLHGVRPNPVTSGGTISFALPERTHATLELVDIAGRRVWVHEVGSLGPGEHSVSLADGSRLATGIYFVRLTQGSRVATVRATVLR